MPAIGTSLLQTAVLVVDRAMLGHHGEASLAAMQIAGPLEWSLLSVFAAFEVGTVARVGRHVGAGDREAARAAALLSFGIALAAGLLISIAAPLLLPHLPSLLPRAGAPAMVEASGYLRWSIGSSPFVFIALAAAATLQASGDTRTPLLIGIVSNVIHVGTNRILIDGAFGIPALGATGAGMSMGFTFLLEALLGTLALLSLKRTASLRRAPAAKPPAILPETLFRDEARRLVAVAVPAVLERILYHLGFTAFVLLIIELGEQAMAANQALIGLEAVCFNSAEGFGIAAAAIVAQELGRGDAKAADRAAGIAHRDAVITLVALGVACLVFQGPLLGIFSTDAPTLALGARTMPILAIAQPFMATGIVLAQALRGAGRTRAVLGVSAIGAIGVRLACTWLFAFGLGLGLVGVWIGSTCDWVVRSALLLTMRHLARRRQMSKRSSAVNSRE